MSASEAIMQNREVFLRLTGKKSGEIMLPASGRDNWSEAGIDRDDSPSSSIGEWNGEISPPNREMDSVQNMEPVFGIMEETIQPIQYPEHEPAEQSAPADPLEAFVYRLEREERLHPQSMRESD